MDFANNSEIFFFAIRRLWVFSSLPAGSGVGLPPPRSLRPLAGSWSVVAPSRARAGAAGCVCAGSSFGFGSPRYWSVRPSPLPCLGLSMLLCFSNLDTF